MKSPKRPIARVLHALPENPPRETPPSEASARHCHLADIIVLQNESKATFMELLECHVQNLKPADAVEYALVEEMVATFWRQGRRYSIETTLLERSGNIQAQTTSTPSDSERRLLERYETRLRRRYKRSLRSLQRLRSLDSFRETSGAGMPNEPNWGLEPSGLDCQTNPGSGFFLEAPGLPNEPNSGTEPRPTDCQTNPNQSLFAGGRVLPNEPKASTESNQSHA